MSKQETYEKFGSALPQMSNYFALSVLGRTDLMLIVILIRINIKQSLFDLSQAL